MDTEGLLIQQASTKIQVHFAKDFGLNLDDQEVFKQTIADNLLGNTFYRAQTK
jgi:hypothetical protein